MLPQQDARLGSGSACERTRHERDLLAAAPGSPRGRPVDRPAAVGEAASLRLDGGPPAAARTSRMASMRWSGVQRVASSKVSTIRNSRYARTPLRASASATYGMVSANVRLVFRQKVIDISHAPFRDVHALVRDNECGPVIHAQAGVSSGVQRPPGDLRDRGGPCRARRYCRCLDRIACAVTVERSRRSGYEASQ